MSLALRIVFMGTPTFAVSVLDQINKSRHKIVGVVTAQDKPAGRGQLLQQSAVKQYAIQNELEILQPQKLKDQMFLTQLAALKADLFVVVAFRMLPKEVWLMPTLGTINLHASLLPAYRGAAPINWAIINGEKQTGVTTFLIDEHIDAGNILMQETVEVPENMNVGQLHDILQEKGAILTVQTCDALAEGHLKATPQIQIQGQRALAPKLFKENTQIDFSKTASEIHNIIRGLDPYPAAWCRLFSRQKQAWVTFKLFSSQVVDANLSQTNGPIASRDGLLFPCGNKTCLLIKEIQMEGKKRIDAKAFIAGNDPHVLSYSL